MCLNDLSGMTSGQDSALEVNSTVSVVVSSVGL